ncbi:MAG: DUF1778 domain-containing protein [Thiolinea sp.]
MRYSETKKERLEARLDFEQKAIIQRAAEIEGRSITDFVVQNAYEAAKKVIEDSTIIRLGAADSKKLVELLMNPVEPSQYLKESADLFKRSNIRIQWQN